MKRWTIALVVVAAVAIAGLGAIYYVAGTPQYTLYLVKRAIGAKDRETFYRHVDADRIVTSAVERAVGGVRAGPNVVSQKATDELIPASGLLIKQRIDERFDDPSSAALLSMSIQSVSYQNNAAFVTLKSPADGTTTTLTLERMPDRQWKIVDLDLSKANIQYSLNEAREKAEELLPPETPKIAPRSLPNL